MPIKLVEDINIQIEAEIALHPEGIGIDELHTALANTISRRTLQRRLKELIDQQKIIPKGKGRGLRYRKSLSNVIRDKTKKSAKDTKLDTEFYIPTSIESQSILDYVRQPIQQRKPVGYDRSFLESYHPNESHYLSLEIRQHLHNIGRSPDSERPAGTYARDILARLLIDLSWASSRLEGNTYTRLDTKNLIELGQEAAGKDRREAQMILNHKTAIELLVDQAEEIGFNTFTFFNLHSLLSENLLADPYESGRLRHRIVEISGTVFHPLSIPQQIDNYFRMLLDKVTLIKDPFEQAFFIMVHIPYLQPFIDVNKRVSRLGANISLIRHNLCPLSFIDVPERAYIEGTLGVYEMKQIQLLCDVFVWAYERSCQRYMVIRETTAEPDPIRLRYREAIITVVTEIIRGLKSPAKSTVQINVQKFVPQEDVNSVVAIVLDDLANLYEGNISRFKLKLSEYQAWELRKLKGDEK